MRARLHGTRRRVYVFLGVLALAGLIEAGVVLAGVGTQRASTTSRAHTPATAGLPASSSHALTASSASSSSSSSSSHVTVGHSVKNDTSRPLRSIRPIAIRPTPDHEANPNPKVPMKGMARPEAARQTRHFPNAMPGTGLNFDGIPFPGVTCNCAPPDTNGEVGATQYVQIVNEGYQVFNKTTGASVLGPVSITTIWSGFGGVCETAGDGDPVVVYDQLANRWVVSQFAGVGTPTDECIAVSTTSDATGSYNRYDFHLGSNFFDYPKLAVWPDAYYVAENVFNASGTSYLGPQPFAFNRSAMLAGTAATFVTTGLLAAPRRHRRLDPPAGRRAESMARLQQQRDLAAVPLPRRLRRAGEHDLHSRQQHGAVGVHGAVPRDEQLRPPGGHGRPPRRPRRSRHVQARVSPVRRWA